MALHIIAVSGTARQRGRQHGEGLRSAVLERDRKWKDHIGLVTGMKPDDFIDAHLAGSHYPEAISRWTPSLLDEVRGLAEGSGLSFEHALAAQLMDEEWLFYEAFRGRHHCSSLGCSRGDGSFAVAAQNMDLPQWTDGSQTILQSTDEQGLKAIILTMAGMIGLCGMNSAGLGVAVNTLAELPSSTSGLPVAFVSRGLLACRNVAGASTFLKTISHAAGQNYVLADARSATDFECSAEGVKPFRPPQARGEAVWHTNHALAGGHAVHTADLEATGGARNSHVRMDCMDRRLGPSGGAWDVAAVKAVLSSRDDAAFPVSRPATAEKLHGFTFASVIWNLLPEGCAHVTAGPPDGNDYRTIGFS